MSVTFFPKRLIGLSPICGSCQNLPASNVSFVAGECILTNYMACDGVVKICLRASTFSFFLKEKPNSSLPCASTLVEHFPCFFSNSISDDGTKPSPGALTGSGWAYSRLSVLVPACIHSYFILDLTLPL